MPPPTPLTIQTSSLTRLLKEESSYHRELASQKSRLQNLECAPDTSASDGDSNREFEIRQQKQAIDETTKVFPPLKQRIEDAMLRLEEAIETEAAKGGTAGEEVEKAKGALEKARELINEGGAS